MWDLVVLTVGTGASLLIGGLVVTSNQRNILGVIYAFVTLSLLLIAIANYLSLNIDFDQLLMVRLVMAAASMAVTGVYFLVVFLKYPNYRIGLAKLLILSASVAVVLYDMTDLLFIDVIKGSPPEPIVGYFPYIFFIHLIATLAMIIKELIGGIMRSDGKQRNRLISVLVGLSPSFLIAPVTGFILPLFFGLTDFVLLTPLYVLFLVSFIGYAIARHGLFDVKMAIVRTVGYAFSLLAMSIIYIIIAYGVSFVFFGGRASEGVGIDSINIILALAIAFIFQPIKTFFDRVTDKVFFRGDYDRDVFFRQFGKIISYDTDLNALLKQSGSYIAETFKAERVFFHIRGRGVFGVGGARRMRREVLESDMSLLESYYKRHHEASEVIVSEATSSEDVRGVLASYKADIALPLIIQGELIGCLFIGEHKSRGFRARDIQAIGSVANELTIAVQNSMSVEEIRDLNENLQHKVETATKELRASNRQLRRLDETKNEFISMASHQLRTPLTSVKGYLDMVLQGDLGRVTSTQRAVLYEAFLSSERMVLLINDFLNISRLQTGKFSIERVKSNLAKVIREELKMMDVLAEQRNLKLKDNIDENIPDMKVDAEKLRQVIINMIDNAIYYSRSGTNIYISLKQEGNELVFKVKDTGIGIPKSEQAGLFGKFFRASNARKRRPDGTGVGLFLAKKIVTLHGGKIIFESEENKGSTFGFKLPMNKQ